LAAAGTWLMTRGQLRRRQAAALVVAGLVTVPTIVWYSGYWPMTQSFADTNVAGMGYSLFTFPMSMASSYNLMLDEFAYRVVLGWPDGFTLIQLPWSMRTRLFPACSGKSV